MAHRFLISHDSPVLYITVVTKDRLPVFRTDGMKEFLCVALDEARKSAGILLFAYVIMWDHLHLLTSLNSTTANVLRVLKGITARRVIDHLKEKSTSVRLPSCNTRNEVEITNTHCGRLKEMCCRFLAKVCLWRS